MATNTRSFGAQEVGTAVQSPVQSRRDRAVERLKDMARTAESGLYRTVAVAAILAATSAFARAQSRAHGLTYDINVGGGNVMRNQFGGQLGGGGMFKAGVDARVGDHLTISVGRTIGSDYATGDGSWGQWGETDIGVMGSNTFGGFTVAGGLQNWNIDPNPNQSFSHNLWMVVAQGRLAGPVELEATVGYAPGNLIPRNRTFDEASRGERGTGTAAFEVAASKRLVLIEGKGSDGKLYFDPEALFGNAGRLYEGYDPRIAKAGVVIGYEFGNATFSVSAMQPVLGSGSTEMEASIRVEGIPGN